MAILNGQIEIPPPLSNDAGRLKSNASSFENSFFQNYLSSFARFFGESSSQDASNIYIQKNELPRLTPLFNNTGESLFISLLLREAIFESNNLVSNIVVEPFKTSLISKNNIDYVNSAFVIKLYLLMLYVGYEITNYDSAFTPDSYQ